MSRLRTAALVVLIAASAGSARAELMQLGTQDFSDGQILGCYSPTTGCAIGWTTPTDPFNRFVGSDPGIAGSVDFSTEWSFNLASLGLGRPGSVRIEIGLYDHDSTAPGSQLAFFVLNPRTGSQDLTAQLDAALEIAGIGEQQEYNVIGLDLPEAVLDSLLASSVATFALKLKGPALIKSQSGGIVVAQGTNGAGLDFARLTLTYGATAPEPSSALLAGLALTALAAARTRGQ